MSDAEGELDPGEVAARASAGERPGPDPADEPAGTADTALPDDGDTSPIGALLHAEPDLSPGDMEDLDPWAADLVIGTIKVAHYYGRAGDGTTGTPAAVNYARGSIGGVRAMQERRAADDDEGGAEGVETA